MIATELAQHLYPYSTVNDLVNLVQQGAIVSDRALFLACKKRLVTLIPYLLNLKEIDPQHDNNRAFYTACEEGLPTPILQLMVYHGAKPRRNCLETQILDKHVIDFLLDSKFCESLTLSMEKFQAKNEECFQRMYKLFNTRLLEKSLDNNNLGTEFLITRDSATLTNGIMDKIMNISNMRQEYSLVEKIRNICGKLPGTVKEKRDRQT